MPVPFRMAQECQGSQSRRLLQPRDYRETTGSPTRRWIIAHDRHAKRKISRQHLPVLEWVLTADRLRRHVVAASAFDVQGYRGMTIARPSSAVAPLLPDPAPVRRRLNCVAPEPFQISQNWNMHFFRRLWASHLSNNCRNGHLVDTSGGRMPASAVVDDQQLGHRSLRISPSNTVLTSSSATSRSVALMDVHSPATSASPSFYIRIRESSWLSTFACD